MGVLINIALICFSLVAFSFFLVEVMAIFWIYEQIKPKPYNRNPFDNYTPKMPQPEDSSDGPNLDDPDWWKK